MLDKVLGVKMSCGSGADSKGEIFSWDNVVLYVEHDCPQDNAYDKYYGHCVDTIKFGRLKVDLNGVPDWPDLVGENIRLSYSVYNGKPVIMSVDVVDE